MIMSTESAVHSELEGRLLPIADRYRGKKGITIPLLADLQREMGYIAPDAVDFFAKELDIPAAEIFGVATFYAQFHLKPRGRHIIRVCRGTACHVRGSLKILESVKEIVGVEENQTTEDLRFTLEPVACLGACGLAPVMMIDTQTFGRLTPDMVKGLLDRFE
ncbi:MAG: NADH-quinone oxidoreductase subunit NuoE [Aminobacteriaceae bacterium]|jgi:NADH-quinone oxidoreductase subunit E|nr:NADH-quinone oxidoreductase subunit NuoE [Synergistaceae bacterium]MDD4020128.1 NADH-quinone oxidoreductase subunit NuoE [Synergistaceae bacterium]MDD4612529.1 NADH-quinone oxidoreductase subunit NuoE [Synergistaceae bacterium]